MEKETNFIEKLIKNIAADKNRLVAFIFSAISLICSFMYLSSVSAKGTHFVFMVCVIAAAATVILYTVDTESKIKCANDCVVFGIAALLLGLILKIARVGISFSVEYTIGYLLYAIAFAIAGIYCTKSEAKLKIEKVLLLICAAWSVYQFFYLRSTFLAGVTWKIFRLSEAFLSISYFCLLNLLEKREVPLSESIGSYKKQVPSLKICIAILLVIAIVSGFVGFVMKLGKGVQSTTTKNTVTQQAATEKPVEKTPKKSTVVSTVVPAEEKTEEVKEIKIGDTIETDLFLFKLNKVEISRRVEPDNPPSYYNYYKAEANHTYIYVNASVTNKDKHPLECDEIYSVTADFDGGYEYKGFNIADDDDGDFTYANITSVEPLTTLGVHCLIDCPQVVEEAGKPLFITINLNNGSKYKYIIK